MDDESAGGIVEIVVEGTFAGDGTFVEAGASAAYGLPITTDANNGYYSALLTLAFSCGAGAGAGAARGAARSGTGTSSTGTGTTTAPPGAWPAGHGPGPGPAGESTRATRE